MPNKKVIDISHWQTIPKDLTATKADGVVGLIHKATEGSSNVDDKYTARKFLAEEAGLLFGAYHFLRPGDMKAQARHFLTTCQPNPGMLLAADHEDNRVSLADLQTWLDEVDKLIVDHGGKRRNLVIYSGHVLKEQLGGKRHPTLNQDNYRLWLAQYSSSYTLPAGWTKYWIWQWTQEGKVAGINPPTDLNDYQGTDEQLTKEWSGVAGGVQPGPEPGPEPGPATGELSPKEFQQALAAGGFYGGAIDGLSGPQTRSAVDAWFATGDLLDLTRT